MVRASGRGGPRQGTPGRSYGNRTDLQAPKVPMSAAPGQQYGARKAQMDAQRATPMGPVPSPAQLNSTPSGGAGGAAIPPAPLPGQVTGLDVPSTRPNEPVTAGLPVGAGPGPEALLPMGGGAGSDVAAQLRAIYARFPNDDVRAILEQMDGA